MKAEQPSTNEPGDKEVEFERQVPSEIYQGEERGMNVKIIQTMLNEIKFGAKRKEWERNYPMLKLFNKVESDQEARELVEWYGGSLYLMPEHFHESKELAMLAVKDCFDVYGCLSKKLQNDRDVALATASKWETTRATNEVGNLRELPKKFRHDRDFVIDYMRKNGAQIEGLVNSDDSVVQKFYHDIEVLVAAASSAPLMCLRNFPEEFKCNPAIVRAALSRNGQSLAFWAGKSFARHEVYPEVIDNEEYVKIAIQNDPSAIEFASERLKKDKEIIKLAQERHKDNMGASKKDITEARQELEGIFKTEDSEDAPVIKPKKKPKKK